MVLLRNLLLLFLLLPLSASAQHWEKARPPEDTWSLAFSSPQIGIAAGDFNALYRSEDGGKSWQSISLIQCANCLINYFVYPFLGDSGVIQATVTGKEAGVIYFYTFDGGRSWDSSYHPEPIVNSITGHVQKDGKAFIFPTHWTENSDDRKPDLNDTGPINFRWTYTSDRGKTWKLLDQTRIEQHNVAWNGYPKLRWTDQLLDNQYFSWSMQQTPSEPCNRGRLTADGGKAWSSPTLCSQSLSALGRDVWLAVKDSDVYRSGDNGKSWVMIGPKWSRGFPHRGLDSVIYYFFDYRSSSFAGKLAQSTDWGKTWEIREFIDSIDVYRVTQFGRDTMMVWGPRGAVFTFDLGSPGSAAVPIGPSSSQMLTYSNGVLTAKDLADKLVTVCDVLGRVVLERHAAGSTFELSFRELPNGCYLITCGSTKLKVTHVMP